MLVQLRIKDLRNLRQVEIGPAKGINLICGGNAAGKTSILEAIYLLGRGRSFRGTTKEPLVTNGQETLELFGRVSGKERHNTGIGLRKGKGKTEVRFDGERISKLSFLAKTLPLSIVTPKSHEILERGPQYRRRYLDWGVFHVEHSFYPVSRRYLRALTQRNAALKQGMADTPVWERELADSGEELNRLRMGYLERLQSKVKETTEELLSGKVISLEWRRGWPPGDALLQVLLKSNPLDRRRGFTQFGPHRADLVIKVDGYPAERHASRGEQKLIVTALQIAQARVILEETGLAPVILMDDLSAELDKANRNCLLKLLEGEGLQIFITATDSSQFSEAGIEKMFHVEQGEVFE